MLPNKSKSVTAIASYYALLARSVHLRVAQPKSDIGVRTMNARESDRLELARLARRVLDSQHRSSIAHSTPSGVLLAAPPLTQPAVALLLVGTGAETRARAVETGSV